jgi:cell wall-associated NlpC family hydrolase
MRFLLFAFIILSFQSLQSQNTALPSASAKQVNSTPELNRTELVTFAKQYLGIPYRKDSYDPEKGFDCSGFVYYIFKKFNVTVPRSSSAYKSFGIALKPDKFKMGDILVFYGYKDSSHIGHVGIICEPNGMKSRFIHCSSGKAYGVTISSLDSKGYKRRFYKCIDAIKQP